MARRADTDPVAPRVYLIGKAGKGTGEKTHAGFNPHETLCGRRLGELIGRVEDPTLAMSRGLRFPTCRRCDYRLSSWMTANGFAV